MNAESPRGTLEDAGATTTARFERLLGHAPTRVWEALTSSDELERWFMPTSLEPRTGGVVSFDPGDGPVTGTVTTWDPPRALAYTWPFPEEGHAHVTWTLEPRDGGGATLLSLVHAELPTDWAPGYGSGWHAYLDRLDAELGDREPPDWAELSAALRPLYQPDRPPELTERGLRAPRSSVASVTHRARHPRTTPRAPGRTVRPWSNGRGGHGT